MKKSIYILCSILMFGMLSCTEEAFYKDEQYKNVVYLLSTEDYNVFPAAYTFNEDGSASTGYLSIGCGGSLPNPEEITVELEPDSFLFDKYNTGNFDVDSSKFAHILAPDKYSIESMTINFPANNADQYVRVPIKVDLKNLSPDSTYFIPLAIKHLSKYETNPEKFNMLYKVSIKNYYAEQLTPTYYLMKGTTLDAQGVVSGMISSTKLVKPLSIRSVRMYAGAQPETAKSTVEEIRKYSIVVSIDENNKVTITPYGTIEVQQMPYDDYWNSYEEIKPEESTTFKKYLYLYYRYRTLTSPGVWSSWVTVKENMYRMESN